MKMLTFDLPLVRMLPYFPPHTLRQLLLLENRWMEWEREQGTLLVKSTRNEKFGLTGANSSGVGEDDDDAGVSDLLLSTKN